MTPTHDKNEDTESIDSLKKSIESSFKNVNLFLQELKDSVSPIFTAISQKDHEKTRFYLSQGEKHLFATSMIGQNVVSALSESFNFVATRPSTYYVVGKNNAKQNKVYSEEDLEKIKLHNKEVAQTLRLALDAMSEKDHKKMLIFAQNLLINSIPSGAKTHKLHEQETEIFLSLAQHLLDKGVSLNTTLKQTGKNLYLASIVHMAYNLLEHGDTPMVAACKKNQPLFIELFLNNAKIAKQLKKFDEQIYQNKKLAPQHRELYQAVKEKWLLSKALPHAISEVSLALPHKKINKL